MKLKLLSLFILINYISAFSCSMYKITMDGKTFVGNNEDHWNANTRIWFEKDKKGGYGCVYVGYDNLYPQGGMNEKGLTFDGFYIDPYMPRHPSKKPMFKAEMGKSIMQTCQDIEEVYNFLSKYNLSSLWSGMMLFVDKAGNYLVVEADTMIKGNDNKYLLSNFCPSRTPNLDAVKIPFYQKGRKMIEAKVDTSLNYLKALSDTLHQEWPLNGAGTLYTTIYDLAEGTINLFFYHDYKYSIKFNLKDELNKKDTVLIIPAMFPDNEKGQDQFNRYNRTKETIESIKDTEIAKDSASLAAFLKSKDLRAMPGFFENDINSIGHSFLREKKNSSAINVFRLNIKYSSHSWSAYNSLANAYKVDKRYALASFYYKKTLELNPNNKEAAKAKTKVDKRLK